MKKIMIKYNRAFGYLKVFFTFCGLIGMGIIITGTVFMMLGNSMEASWGMMCIGAAFVLAWLEFKMIMKLVREFSECDIEASAEK